MPITQSVNSKANVKKFTNSDLPFAPQQPVMTPYYAVSTAGQTVINLSFSVDTVNLSDQFFLFVDGKKLRLGASNDYTFTTLDSAGRSSQVTLNQALIINQNIQAYNFGLKKEVEFGTDNRFVQLYAAEGSGFQGFIDQVSFSLSPTTTTGSPAAGTFYSQITGRAPIVDLSQDLKPRMGIERIATQQIQQIPNEFGPNGEPVYGVVNDLFNQIRLVGSGITSYNTTSGIAIAGSLAGDFIEVTFYGTGLNLCTFPGASMPVTAAIVDGVQITANIFQTNYSTILQRSYSPNMVIPVASNLTLGIHTVTMKITTAGALFLNSEAIEILNESSLVKVASGIGYIQGKKYTSSALQSFAFNSVATGVRGGRVVVYQNGDGTIGQAWQAVNASQANNTSADHTNEEVARTHQFREFGYGRADDFSLNNFSNANLAFALEDGTTNLVGSGVTVIAGQRDSVGFQASGSYLQITFVGTGLDYLTSLNDGLTYSATYTVAVDGTNTVTAVAASTLFGRTTRSGIKQVKVVSGLPYGTHVVRITTPTGGVAEPISQFIIYQPKKPSIPAGTIELSDYNVMATFVANSTSGLDTIATGVLRKSLAQREATYVGTWSSTLGVASYPGGWNQTGSTAGNYVEYVFFGTGFEYRAFASTVNATFTIDGATNFTVANSTPTYGAGWTAALTTSQYGHTSFTASTGVLVDSALSVNGAGVSISGLTMGIHKVRLAYNSGTNLNSECFDIVTPIHSYKSNLYADLENSLPTGSCGISDNRKVTPVKEILPITKAWAQAQGIQGTITQSTSTLIPMNDMSVTIKTTGGPVQISWNMSCYSGTSNTQVQVQVYVDGKAVWVARHCQVAGIVNSDIMLSDLFILPLAAGTHKVDLYWSNGGSNTVSNDGAERILTVREL